ncbi:solute carrier organic anion transporter family member 2A1-like [Asterias rubens]|uniref:solute carrier organic anion transporter family member 2A1-like n=1 Tax=Asterias rubens TaxID=7604 RepID=UPI0014557DB8|nr:solute carrier organic anion transporter family member 2A1-like [Asterias rubens]
MPTYTQIAQNDSPPEEKHNGVVVEEDIEEDEFQNQCGLGCLRCRCLKVFAHPNVFVLCVGMMVVTMIGATGVYLAGVISTIEKRFQLKSSESGIILSMNDISALCGVLFVTYFGGKSHRPRIIGISGIILAVGTFGTALPQFIYDNPGLDDIITSSDKSGQTTGGSVYAEELTCNVGGNYTKCTSEEIDASGSQLGKAWPILMGQLLCGVGGTSIIPLALTYLDDAVEKRLLPMYLALTFLPMTFSALMGFSISSFCLSIYTDFYKTDASALGLNPRDPRWQGAWWLGFIIYGFILLACSVPFFFFPRKMDKPKSYCCFTGVPECCKVLTKRGGPPGGMGVPTGETPNAGTKLSKKTMEIIKEFLASLWRLLTNSTYMSATFGYCCSVLAFSGSAVFIAKYMQYEFAILPSRAGVLLGLTIMPGTVIGVMLGGILTTMVAGSQRRFVVLTLILHSLTAVGYGILMLVGCQNDSIAGLTTEYGYNGHLNDGTSFEINAPCNMDCTCEKGDYSPVCGTDGMTYATACYAGCEAVSLDPHNNTVYQDCKCINQTQEYPSNFATKGPCASTCDMLMIFIVSFCVVSAIKASTHNSSFMLKFRSVLPKDRELAVGLSSFLSKILGFIPAPIIYGAAIESQCLFWQESCEKTGECMQYDRPGLRYVYFGLTGGLKLIVVLCYCLSAYFVFRGDSTQNGNEEEKNATEFKDETKTRPGTV